MKFAELLCAEQIRVPLQSRNKAGVLRELVALLPSAKDATACDAILESVLEREAKMSTGIGQGVAIPHGRSDLIPDMEMAFGISSVPIEFDSLDGKPVEIFFLIVTTPAKAGAHIQALARISRMLASERLREGLAEVRTPEGVLELFRREDPS
ncbi:MAG TPA: PTS sugar transporter subunit IIA [bacterium]|nr:PTS sugar transporter subunit IIA [bacterium]